MSAMKRFEHECIEAGADVATAVDNLAGGMLWQEAIEKAVPGRRLGFTPVTVGDAAQIHDLVREAEACLEQAAAQIRTLLQQRDLVSEWDDEAAAYRKTFEPVVADYHRLMRGLLTMQERPFGWEHALRWMVEAQR